MEEYNPWWFNEIDPLYEEWLNLKVKWVPEILEKFEFKPYSLHFFIGPRQVGKTTALKILIHQLIKERNPKSIFYYACDELADYRELGEILDNYISMKNFSVELYYIEPLLEEINNLREEESLEKKRSFRAFESEIYSSWYNKYARKAVVTSDITSLMLSRHKLLIVKGNVYSHRETYIREYGITVIELARNTYNRLTRIIKTCGYEEKIAGVSVSKIKARVEINGTKAQIEPIIEFNIDYLVTTY